MMDGGSYSQGRQGIADYFYMDVTKKRVDFAIWSQWPFAQWAQVGVLKWPEGCKEASTVCFYREKMQIVY